MKLLWDEPKRLANLDKHGMDFARIELDFFATAVVLPGHSGRFRALGRVDGAAAAVVFKPLGSQVISIISVRPASRSEGRLIDG